MLGFRLISHLATDSFQPSESVMRFLYTALERALRDGQLTNALTRQLNGLVHKGGQIDYARYAAAFTYKYWPANYAKTMLAIQPAITKLSELKSIRILDLGCGSGASTAAAIKSVDNNQGVSPTISIDAVDSSAEQLQLFASTILPWRSVKNSSSDHIGIHFADVVDFLTSFGLRNRWDLIIASYLFSELDTVKARQVATLLAALQANAIVIVDYDHRTDESYVQYGLEGEKNVLPRIVVDTSHLDILGLQSPSGSRSGNTAILKDSGSAVPSALIRYFDAWTNYDIDLLEELFSEDAKYVIVGRGTLHGIAQIKDYWSQNAIQQEGIKCEITDWIQTNNLIVARWAANFRRVDREMQYNLAGLLSLELEGSRIYRLMECYHRSVE